MIDARGTGAGYGLFEKRLKEIDPSNLIAEFPSDGDGDCPFSTTQINYRRPLG